MGAKARMCARYMAMESLDKKKDNRKGFYAMWKYAAPLLTKWKIPKAGEFDENNAHAGKMWGSPQEFRRYPLTERRLALILEAVYEGGAPKSTVERVRKTCSFIFMLKTGVPLTNFPKVTGMWRILQRCDFIPKQATPQPIRVPTPGQMVATQHSRYHDELQMSHIEHIQGYLGWWSLFGNGARPSADVDRKLKTSETHYWFPDHLICTPTDDPSSTFKRPECGNSIATACAPKENTRVQQRGWSEASTGSATPTS